MKQMSTLEGLYVFKNALELMVAIYSHTKSFPRDERFGLTQQLRRASVSVISHLAEGQGRLTAGEWRQFLSQARGSLFEVQAQLIAAHRLEYLDDCQYGKLRSSVRCVAQPLTGLINYVKSRERPTASKRGR